MSSIIRWRRLRRAAMDSGLFMGRLLLLERSQNAQCSPGAAQPGCYVSVLTASSHAPLPRSGFVLRPTSVIRRSAIEYRRRVDSVEQLPDEDSGRFPRNNDSMRRRKLNLEA